MWFLKLGGGYIGLVFNKYTISVTEWKVLKVHCTTMWIYLALPQCILRYNLDGKFDIILYQNKNSIYF